MKKTSKLELECLKKIQNLNVRGVALQANELKEKGYFLRATYSEAYQGEKA